MLWKAGNIIPGHVVVWINGQCASGPFFASSTSPNLGKDAREEINRPHEIFWVRAASRSARSAPRNGPHLFLFRLPERGIDGYKQNTRLEVIGFNLGGALPMHRSLCKLPCT